MSIAIPVNITAFYTGLLVLWVAVLAVPVLRLRLKYRVSTGSGGYPALELARRIHGNAAEWTPLGLAPILVLELLAASVWLIHGLGVLLLVARVLHAAGLQRTGAESWERGLGILLQMIQYLVGGVACLTYALVA